MKQQATSRKADVRQERAAKSGRNSINSQLNTDRVPPSSPSRMTQDTDACMFSPSDALTPPPDLSGIIPIRSAEDDNKPKSLGEIVYKDDRIWKGRLLEVPAGNPHVRAFEIDQLGFMSCLPIHQLDPSLWDESNLCSQMSPGSANATCMVEEIPYPTRMVKYRFPPAGSPPKYVWAFQLHYEGEDFICLLRHAGPVAQPRDQPLRIWMPDHPYADNGYYVHKVSGGQTHSSFSKRRTASKNVTHDATPTKRPRKPKQRHTAGAATYPMQLAIAGCQQPCRLTDPNRNRTSEQRGSAQPSITPVEAGQSISGSSAIGAGKGKAKLVETQEAPVVGDAWGSAMIIDDEGLDDSSEDDAGTLRHCTDLLHVVEDSRSLFVTPDVDVEQNVSEHSYRGVRSSQTPRAPAGGCTNYVGIVRDCSDTDEEESQSQGTALRSALRDTRQESRDECVDESLDSDEPLHMSHDAQPSSKNTGKEVGERADKDPTDLSIQADAVSAPSCTYLLPQRSAAARALQRTHQLYNYNDTTIHPGCNCDHHTTYYTAEYWPRASARVEVLPCMRRCPYCADHCTSGPNLRKHINKNACPYPGISGISAVVASGQLSADKFAKILKKSQARRKKKTPRLPIARSLQSDCTGNKGSDDQTATSVSASKTTKRRTKNAAQGPRPRKKLRISTATESVLTTTPSCKTLTSNGASNTASACQIVNSPERDGPPDEDGAPGGQDDLVGGDRENQVDERVHVNTSCPPALHEAIDDATSETVQGTPMPNCDSLPQQAFAVPGALSYETHRGEGTDPLPPNTVARDVCRPSEPQVHEESEDLELPSEALNHAVDWLDDTDVNPIPVEDAANADSANVDSTHEEVVRVSPEPRTVGPENGEPHSNASGTYNVRVPTEVPAPATPTRQSSVLTNAQSLPTPPPTTKRFAFNDETAETRSAFSKALAAKVTVIDLGKEIIHSSVVPTLKQTAMNDILQHYHSEQNADSYDTSRLSVIELSSSCVPAKVPEIWRAYGGHRLTFEYALACIKRAHERCVGDTGECIFKVEIHHKGRQNG